MKDDGPRVSIGMPVHNSERYVEAAIKSVLAQTYADFELIISDNASTDQTPKICQAYAAKEQRIRFFRNTRNLGAAWNINHVAELSSGEYFKWAFYDDLIAPQFLASCVEALDQNPSVVLCVPKSNVIDEHERLLGVHEYRADTTAQKPHLRFRNYVLNYDAGWEIFGLIRLRSLRRTALHGWYPGSDHVLLAELSLYGQFLVIPDALLFPRIHPEQMWITTPKERDRLAFYSPSLSGKIVLTKWGWVSGYLRAIANAPLSGYERAHCCVTLVRWMLKLDHVRALGMDVLLASRLVVIHSFSRRRGTLGQSSHGN